MMKTLRRVNISEVSVRVDSYFGITRPLGRAIKLVVDGNARPDNKDLITVRECGIKGT
jgi:hypothetical protein